MAPEANRDDAVSEVKAELAEAEAAQAEALAQDVTSPRARTIS
nr:hypothetical protein [Candidatus Mycolicibacterium alkanivorans]